MTIDKTIITIIKALLNGRISADEATVLMSFAQADAIDDTNRIRDRMHKAIGTLHGLAIEGINRAKDSVG